jgi:hypothetical protein
MTSNIRSLSQIPVRTKYLLVVTDRDLGQTERAIVASSVFSLTAGANPGSLIASTTALTGYVEVAATAGQLYKDLGRQITVVDTLGEGAEVLAVYRQVQLMNGAGSEGVANNATYSANLYVKVFSADGLNVIVARTG